MHEAQTPSEVYEKVTTPSKTVDGKTVDGKKRCSPNVIGKSLIGVGVFLVIFSIIYGTVLPKVIDKKIKDGVVTCNLKDARKTVYTDPYGDCKDCSPYYYNLYMFNITNAEDHLATNAKLKLKEVGPWVYRRRQIRGNVSFDNERVSYTQYTYHTFEQERSCDGCTDQDVVIGYDVGYLNVIAQAGGERAFLTRLALGTFAKTGNVSTAAAQIATSAPQMMRWVNGLNSLDPEAMKTVTADGLVIKFLLGGPTALTNLTMEGFAFNGVFAKRSISQWALGFPSLLAGLGLGANYLNVCQTGGMEKQCAACTGAECLAIYAECKKCVSGKRVVTVNPLTCGIIEKIYASKYGEAEAKTFAAGTCGSLCTSSGLCAAPLPGIIEKSGLDYSKSAPPASSLNKYIARTGCDDKNFINEYEQYDGYTATALWAKLDTRRNPTLSEIIAFQTYANCISPLSNVSCSVVRGNDATSVNPGGASITGFEKDLDIRTNNIYLLQGNQNVTVYNQDLEVKFKGITLHRFAAAKDLLTSTSTNERLGTGYPVDGVQPLAFSTNFLAYVSFPLYLWGDRSLLENYELTMSDGVVASHDTMYDNGVLKTEYDEKYATYMDMEAGTGKTMRVRRRLQASYAMSYSVSDPTVVMSDVLWPTLPAEVIVPAYWGEESAEAAPKRVSYYKNIKRLLGSLIPVLVVGILLGLALFAGGIWYRRKTVASTKSAAGDV